MNDPAVLRFETTIGSPPGGAKTATGLAFGLPAAIGAKFGASESAEGAVNGHPFRAALERAADGTRSIRMNRAMLRGANAAPGDTVRVALLGPEPPLVVPPDLRRAMKASGEATALWADMPDLARRDYVRWVEGTKNPATRARRVERTVEQLAEGKRRPCCFNAYDYPMSRIDPDYAKKFTKKA